MLTDIQCRNAQPKLKPYKISDSGGLYLEVRPNGSRYWRLKYYIHEKEKRISLGVYPKTSLLEAREKREAAKKAHAQGFDPSELRQEQKRVERYKAEQTFEVVARQWHSHYYDTWSKNHADNILYRLKADIFPYIGKCPIAKLTPPALLACLQRVEDRKRHELSRRLLQICGQVLRYAVVTGRAERDFTPDFKGSLKKYQKGHFASIDIDELPKFLKALRDNEARMFKQTTLAMHFLLLTFVRTSELLHATWDEIDLENAKWVIPAERMKMRMEHIVPLSEQAIEILLEAKETFGDKGYIFPSVFRVGKPMSNGVFLMALKRLNYQNKMTGHGFRSLAMSAIKERLGYRHEVIDRQLAHMPRNKVDKAYDRAKFIAEREKMMQEWADYIDSLYKI